MDINDLNKIKSDMNLVNAKIDKVLAAVGEAEDNLNKINPEEQPEEFQRAAIVYSQSKDNLTGLLLRVVDSLEITLFEVIEYTQSSPKARLWTPESVR